MRPTALYRMFDKGGGLLYVGVSLGFVYRLSRHNAEKPWADQITNVTVERFDSRRDALEAEAKAITAENPRYNVQRPTRAPAVGKSKGAMLLRVTREQNTKLRAIAASQGISLAAAFRQIIDEADEDWKLIDRAQEPKP